MYIFFFESSFQKIIFLSVLPSYKTLGGERTTMNIHLTAKSLCLIESIFVFLMMLFLLILFEKEYQFKPCPCIHWRKYVLPINLASCKLDDFCQA